LQRFVREDLGLRLGYNERDFAGSIGEYFDPAVARANSASFDYFWTCMEAVTGR
jgi:hypothetical protein